MGNQSLLGLVVQPLFSFQPPVSPIIFQPTPRSLLLILLQRICNHLSPPICCHILQHLPYKNRQPFFGALSVTQTRNTLVNPSSNLLATGLPTMATPNKPSNDTPMQICHLVLIYYVYESSLQTH